MFRNIKTAVSGFIQYRGETHFAFLMHRIAGLATIAFLTLHILTTSTVFFAPQWYDVLIQIFRNPLVMIIEIILAFFVIYHGVNGLRLAYVDLFRPDLWEKNTTPKMVKRVLLIALILWLPALAIMGYNLLHYGLGWVGVIRW